MIDEKYIEEVAKVTIKILKKEGAIRLADNLNPDGVDVKDLLIILEEKGFSISQSVYYNKVRPKCERLGYGITACGRGQFIGGKGEAIARNVHKGRNQVLGRAANMRKSLTAAGEAMTLDEGNTYSKIHFQMSLLECANVFEVLGKVDPLLAWPKVLKTYLLEASQA